MNDIALSLPKIRGNPKQLKDKILEHKKSKLQDDPNEFEEQMNKIVEIKIYLKSNFHKTDIDDLFLGNLDEQYASLYLEKMGKNCSKFNLQKILKIKPVEKCDFQLSVDQIRNKPVKVLHIFPNNKTLIPDKDLKNILSNDDVEDVVNKTAAVLRETNEDKLFQIKKKELKKDEVFLFQPEVVENLINRARDDINDKLLYLQASGTVEQQAKNYDLSIETIRRKYMNPNNTNIIVNKDIMKGNAKFQNIDKVAKRDILTDQKYGFPFLDILLNKDILIEINKPLEIPVEIIVKDINYILDNFPIEELVQLDDENKKPENLNKNANMTEYDKKIKKNSSTSKYRSKSAIKKNDFFSKNPKIMENVEKSYKKSSGNKFFKIKSIEKSDILYVYKKLQMPCIYRIIGLLINMLYWIVFGYINRNQIDKYTKQQMLFKIYEELDVLEANFTNRKIYDKLFMPILILIVRIECEAIFFKKFKNLFDDKINLEISMEKINEIITHIFDPNCYYNTFTIMANDMSKLKHQINKDLNPNYKTKVNATSNLLNQLFTTFTNEKNVKIFRNKFDEKKKKANPEDIEEQRKYILESKVDFYKVLLNKVNNNLKKRNMDPIFFLNKNNTDNV